MFRQFLNRIDQMDKHALKQDTWAIQTRLLETETQVKRLQEGMDCINANLALIMGQMNLSPVVPQASCHEEFTKSAWKAETEPSQAIVPAFRKNGHRNGSLNGDGEPSERVSREAFLRAGGTDAEFDSYLAVLAVQTVRTVQGKPVVTS